eukprot:8422072-Alexandrium_andersonii.AAC.1
MNCPASGAGAGALAATSVRLLPAKKMGSAWAEPSRPATATTAQMSPGHLRNSTTAGQASASK